MATSMFGCLLVVFSPPPPVVTLPVVTLQLAGSMWEGRKVSVYWFPFKGSTAGEQPQPLMLAQLGKVGGFTPAGFCKGYLLISQGELARSGCLDSWASNEGVRLSNDGLLSGVRWYAR